MTTDEEIAGLAQAKEHEKLSVLARRLEDDIGACDLSPASLRTVFEALFARNENARAERWLEVLLPFTPDDVTLLSNKGRFCLLRSDWSDAVPFYERALGLRPELASLKAPLALCLLNLQQFDRAAELYESALATDPAQKYWWIYLAQACIGAGRHAQAADAYRSALAIEHNAAVQAELDRLEWVIAQRQARAAAAQAPIAAQTWRRPSLFPVPEIDLAMYGSSVIPSYRSYLAAFTASGRRSVLMRELAAATPAESVYAHRHDVDHSIEQAYLMAAIEADCGVVATYYMLHPGDYGSLANYYGTIEGDRIRHSARLAFVCKAMQDMGHEIGLHNNFVQLSMQTGVPAAELIRREVAWFESIGVRVTGCASHGSDFARRFKFTNYEIFRECRSGGAQPGRTIEAADNPEDDTPFRFKLHEITLADANMGYEAYFLPYTLYLSDTGSRFTISGAGSQAGLAVPAPGSRPVSMEAVAQSLALAPGAAVSLVHADWWRSTANRPADTEWLSRIC